MSGEGGWTLLFDRYRKPYVEHHDTREDAAASADAMIHNGTAAPHTILGPDGERYTRGYGGPWKPTPTEGPTP